MIVETVEQHRSRSVADEQEALALAAATPGSRWIIVMRFYAALHLTQAYLLTKNARFAAGDHRAREVAIRESPELSQGRGRRFRESYRAFKDLSEQARYDAGFTPGSSDITQSITELSIVQSFLNGPIRIALEKTH